MTNRPEGIVFGSELTGYSEESCDVCVVGSGPGGAVAAEVLAQRGLDVLVIEEGPLPEADGPLAPDEAMAKYYRDSGFFATHWPMQVPIPTGRVFGGTSVINSGTCFHTPERIFDWWADEVGTEFDRTAWRSVEAELDTELSIKPCPVERMAPSNRLFAEGLAKLGLSPGSALNRCEKDCDGSGLCCFVCPKGAKQAMHLNLLKRALGHGMRAMVETKATGLIQDGRRVTGLLCRTEAGGRLKVSAERFILAMGALETPYFLLKNHLRRRYPAVGRHLSIHPATEVFAEAPDVVRAWEGVPQAYHYEHPDYPDVHFEGSFIPASLGAGSMPFLGADLAEWIKAYDRVIAFGFFLSDSKHGRLVRVPGLRHLIRYQFTEHDLDGFYFAVKLIARAHFAVGARRVLLPIANAGNVYESVEELEARFRREDLSSKMVYTLAFHPLGTCRFSSAPDKGVVDRFGRCHDHDNLYILDGSAIPGPLGVNPQITIMAFSRLAARALAEQTAAVHAV